MVPRAAQVARRSGGFGTSLGLRPARPHAKVGGIAQRRSPVENLMRVMVTYPPLKGKGSPMLTQNRQFQWFHEPSYLYPCVPASAATLLQSLGHEVLWNDCIAEQKDMSQFLRLLRDFKPELVAMETKSPVVRQHWALTEMIKAEVPGVKVVLFGDHISGNPTETMEKSQVDYCITGGDYDFSLESLVNHITRGDALDGGFYYRNSDGTHGTTGPYKGTRSLEELPYMDRHLTNAHLYFEKWKKRLPFLWTMAGRDIARALVGCDTDAATSLAMSHGAGQEAAGVVSEFQQVLEAIEALPQLETEGSEYQPGTHIRYRLFESGQRIFAGSGFPLAIGYGARGSCLWNRLDLDDPGALLIIGPPPQPLRIRLAGVPWRHELIAALGDLPWELADHDPDDGFWKAQLHLVGGVVGSTRAHLFSVTGHLLGTSRTADPFVASIRGFLDTSRLVAHQGLLTMYAGLVERQSGLMLLPWQEFSRLFRFERRLQRHGWSLLRSQRVLLSQDGSEMYRPPSSNGAPVGSPERGRPTAILVPNRL